MDPSRFYFDQGPRGLVPHFLFRAISDQSRGVNRDEYMCANVEDLKLVPFDSATVEDTRDMLRHHLLWHYGAVSDFISWSSSILFALHHAVRMSRHEKKSNVRIAILDTRTVSQVPIYPATYLLRKLEVPSCDKLTHHYYDSEYLAYGLLTNEGHSCYGMASLEDMCKRGLEEQFPEFFESTEWHKLFIRIRELRSCFFWQDTTLPDNVTIRDMRELGALFGDKFKVVATCALVALRYGQCGIPIDSLLDALRQPYRSIVPTNYVDTANHFKYEAVDQHPYESLRFSIIMRMLFEARNASRRVEESTASRSAPSADSIDDLERHLSTIKISGLESKAPDCISATRSVASDSDSGWGGDSDGPNPWVEDEYDSDAEAEESNAADNMIRVIEGNWDY